MAGEIINRLNVGHVVNVKLTDSEAINGQNFVDAYNYAKTLTPNGQALSATNRVTIILQPGNYRLSSQLTINTQFVDIIGLGSIKLRRGAIAAVIITGYNLLNVTANDVRIKGISVGTGGFYIGSNLPLQVFEDCTSEGNYNSFNNTIVAGTFINCIGGSYAFAGIPYSAQNASGTFINCLASSGSFGSSTSGSVASGLFVNCATSSGTGFGNSGTASGTFIDCESNSSSFGNTASGTFINCIGGLSSFGGSSINGTPSGKFYQCRLTSGSFKTVSGGGLMRNCIDGNNNIVDQ